MEDIVNGELSLSGISNNYYNYFELIRSEELYDTLFTMKNKGDLIIELIIELYENI